MKSLGIQFAYSERKHTAA